MEEGALDEVCVSVRRDARIQTKLMVAFYLVLVEIVTSDVVGAGWYVSDGQNANCALTDFFLGSVRIFDCERRKSFGLVGKERLVAKMFQNSGEN